MLLKNNELKNNLLLTKRISQLDLIKEQEQFKTFMEYAPALAWINDEDGILQYMNTLFKKAFRLPENVYWQKYF